MTDEAIQLTVGASISSLDIYLTSNSVPVAASVVYFYVRDAANVISMSGQATTDTTGHYLASGTIPAGYTYGTWNIDWNVFPVGGGIPLREVRVHADVDQPALVAPHLHDALLDVQALLVDDYYTTNQTAQQRFVIRQDLEDAPLAGQEGAAGPPLEDDALRCGDQHINRCHNMSCPASWVPLPTFPNSSETVSLLKRL